MAQNKSEGFFHHLFDGQETRLFGPAVIAKPQVLKMNEIEIGLYCKIVNGGRAP
jgi:hypothetical protein